MTTNLPLTSVGSSLSTKAPQPSERSQSTHLLSKSPGALILGGAHGSLAVARGLGRHHVPVHLVTDDHRIAAFSRYTKKMIRWSGPRSDTALEDLLDIARKHNLRGSLLLPSGDAEVYFVARNHAALSANFRIVTPRWKIARYALDKKLTYDHAAALGIAVPLSYYPDRRENVAELVCSFPLILKPTFHDGWNRFTSAKAWRVNTRADLIARYDEAAALVPREHIVVQELIPGAGEVQFSYAGVWNEGTPVAWLVCRRTRQYPIDFGFTSTFVETVEHKEIEEAASRFLASLSYSGLVELEFKYDTRDGRFKLLDFNARPWTWIGLGAAAGVDFAWVLWRLVGGENVPPTRAINGVAWIHFWRDAIAVSQHFRQGTCGARSYFALFRRRLVFAAFAIDDPLPGLVDLPLTLWRQLEKTFYKLRRKHVLPNSGK